MSRQRWVENQLTGQAQRMVNSGMKSSWRPVTSGVTQGSIQAPVLFTIFSYELDDGAGCTLSKSADDPKPGGVTDVPEGHAATQKDLVRLETRADRNLLKFNKENGKVLQMRRKIPCTSACWGTPNWKAAWHKRTWRSWWTPN